MLTKLAYIAEVADKSGHYEFADLTAQLLKQAGVFDALYTLLDPSHSGLDQTSGWWKRLLKGWRRGRMDKAFGLALAIKAELNQLNAKINESIAPIKDFQALVADFYDKVMAGDNDVNAGNLNQELKDLQRGLRDTLSRVTDAKLKAALNHRQRLKEQLAKAIERIRGLGDDEKEFLVETVLQGKKAPLPEEAKMAPSAGGGSEEKAQSSTTGRSNDLSDMRGWLRTLSIKRMPVGAGAKTGRGQNFFRDFADKYGFNPIAITEFFDQNGEAQAEGLARFSEPDTSARRRMVSGDDKKKPTGPFPGLFSEMLRLARQVQKNDERYVEEESGKPSVVEPKTPETAQSKPSATPLAPPPTPDQAAQRRKEMLDKAEEEARKAQMAPGVAPVSPSKEEEIIPAPGLSVEEEKLRREISPELRQRLEEVRRVRERVDQLMRYQAEKKAKEEERRKAKKASKPKSPAKTSAERIERQIMRLARMRDIKMAMDENDYWDDLGNRLEEEEASLKSKMEAEGKIECPECSMYVKPGQMHYPGGDPEEGPAHTPEQAVKYEPETEIEVSNKEPEEALTDIFDVYPEGQERYKEDKEYDPAQMMLDEYTDIQSDWDYEEKGDLERRLNRLKRQIKTLETMNDKSEEGQKALKELYDEMYNLGGRLEIMEENGIE